MILGTEAIGVLNVGLDDSVVYGAQNYADISRGGTKVGGVGPGIINLLGPSTLNISVSGIGVAGHQYDQISTVPLSVGGVGSLGFVYGVISAGSLTAGGYYSQTSTQSDIDQPLKISTSAQSLMSWYTTKGQYFDKNSATLTLSGADNSFYLPASTFSGGASAVVPEIWIG
jgi:hypothetical protein